MRYVWMALLLVWVGRVMKPRGIRNHNPGNLRRTGTRWQGMALDQSSDPEYVVFMGPAWGLRAMVKVLRTYRSKYGLNTVAGIISRWAPPSENPTDAYIAAVSRALGVAPTEQLDVEARMVPLVKAIVHHENGVQPYPDALFDEALRLAG